ELAAEPRHAEILELEHRRRRAARAALRANGLTNVLEIEDLVAGDERSVLTERDRDRLPLAAVDRVTQLDVLEPEIVARHDPQRHLYDIARTPVTTRRRHLDDGFLVGDHIDEVVVRDTD